jgi:hypothetical protein
MLETLIIGQIATSNSYDEALEYVIGMFNFKETNELSKKCLDVMDVFYGVLTNIKESKND